MKKAFSGFIPIDTDYERKIWESAAIVADTNVLVNLYRYSKPTRIQVLEVLKAMSSSLWIPHQVGLEFSKNRISVIRSLSDTYDMLKNKLRSSLGKLEEDVHKLAGKHRHPVLDGSDLLNDIRECVGKCIDKIDDIQKKSHHPIENDELLDEIHELFKDKVGIGFEPEEFWSIIDEAKIRYDLLVPPGYKDKKRKPGIEKYGDVILWKQIIKYATENNTCIIFITDDNKSDWWGEDSNLQTVLRQELIDASGEDIIAYTVDEFLQASSTFRATEIDQSSVEETKQVAASYDDIYNFIKQPEYLKAVQSTKEMGEAVRNIYNLGSMFESYYKPLKTMGIDNLILPKSMDSIYTAPKHNVEFSITGSVEKAVCNIICAESEISDTVSLPYSVSFDGVPTGSWCYIAASNSAWEEGVSGSVHVMIKVNGSLVGEGQSDVQGRGANANGRLDISGSLSSE